MSKASRNDVFLDWFRRNGGSVHPGVGLTTFPSTGRGTVALQNIKKNTVLFTLPRSLTLSTRTSSLPSRFGERQWKKYKLHKGWTGLILCILWEDAAGESGYWSEYLNSLPDRFQTPMFWNNDDLDELYGTSIYDKIGKVEAETDYSDKLLPAIKSRPDLFPATDIETFYSLQKYHVMGSRILSRSFHVERWEGKEEESGDEQAPIENARKSDGMDIDSIDSGPNDEDQGKDAQEIEESDDDDDPSDVTMVPLADLLNARYQQENARLCYESEELQMISTRDIQKDEQIWNTYGDLPNSELLRRYGHVDMIPVANGAQGNPGDVAEIRADVVLDVLRTQHEKNGEPLLERIEWWLEEGGDDVFLLETTSVLPDELTSLIRLLAMSKEEWERTRDKGRIPKPRADDDILRVVETVLKKRVEAYKTTLEEDETFLETTKEVNHNRYMAIVVRLGEKRILKGTLEEVTKKLAEEGKGNKKRHLADEDVPAAKGKKVRTK